MSGKKLIAKRILFYDHLMSLNPNI
jgi:hypothetical protein